MISIHLTQKQFDKLSRIVGDAEDQGPVGQGWASDELQELREILAKVETQKKVFSWHTQDE